MHKSVRETMFCPHYAQQWSEFTNHFLHSDIHCESVRDKLESITQSKLWTKWSHFVHRTH